MSAQTVELLRRRAVLAEEHAARSVRVHGWRQRLWRRNDRAFFVGFAAGLRSAAAALERETST